MQELGYKPSRNLPEDIESILKDVYKFREKAENLRSVIELMLLEYAVDANALAEGATTRPLRGVQAIAIIIYSCFLATQIFDWGTAI